jgi:hypothetical protein
MLYFLKIFISKKQELLSQLLYKDKKYFLRNYYVHVKNYHQHTMKLFVNFTLING